MIWFLIIFIKILLCLISFVFLVLFLILFLPIRYLLDIKISEQRSVLFCLSYFFGLIKIKYDKKFKIKVLGLDIKNIKIKYPKTKKNIRSKPNKKDNKIKTHEKSGFNYESLKDFLPAVLEFIFDIIKIIRPKSIKIDGKLGLENPADTGYVCAILSCVTNIFDSCSINNKLKFDFNNKFLDFDLIFTGKSYALVFILIVLKYLRRNKVSMFLRNIKNI